MDLTTLTGTLTISKSVTSIGASAFEGTGINKLELPPEGNLAIGDSAFYGTKISGTLTIPNSVTSIGAYAFYGTGISGTLTISKSVTSIGVSAFQGTGINKLELPQEGNLAIGDSAFQGTSISGTLIIPSSVTSIGDSAFQGTSISGTLIIPSSVTSIGSSAFQGCTMLTAVDLSAYSGDLNPMVFWGCTSLNQITLGYLVAPVTQNNVFAGCAVQGTIYYPAGATGYTKEAFMKGGFSEWTFTAYATFNVTVSPAANGAATASHITARPGTIVNLSVQHIDRGYIFSSWNVRHNSVTWTDDTNASSPIARFIMPGNDVTIIPTFTKTVITPNAPQDLQVVKGVRQVTLSWNAPLDNNALPLTAYQVRVDNGNWINIDSSRLSYTFTNLTSAPHTFEVRAVNEEAQGVSASLQASPLGNGDTVTLLQAISNGEEDVVTTTTIWLLFDQPVDGLTADDISLGDNPGFTINSLTGSGRDWKLSLADVKQPTVVTLQLPGLTTSNIKVNYETSEIPIHYHYLYYIKNVILLSHVLSTQLFVGEPQTVGRLWVWDVSPEIQNSLSYQWYICKPGGEFELVADASGNFFTYHAEWPAGTYQLQVIVSAAGAKSVTSNILKFTILEKTYGFSINYNNPQGTYPFPNCPQGYTETETKKVKITSTGTVKITPNDITVSLSDSADEYFEVSAVRYDPESSGNCFFTIKPNLGLSAGNYSATVKVSGSEPHGEEYSFSVSFVVWPPPQYTIDVQSSEGGTASANKESALEGETITLTAVPEKTHVFKEWQISSNNVTLSDPTSPTVTFIMPAERVTIKAVFDALPTGTITLADHAWNDLPEAIDFNLFFKSEQTVTVTASDDSEEAVTIAYYLHYGDAALTAEDLKTITWNSYGEAFSIVQEGKLIIYAKLTDNANNTTYLSSEGIIIDKTPPLLEGAEDNHTYNAALTITVSDTNLKSVLLNGEEQSIDGSSTSHIITLNTNGTYTIKATDKAGNEAEITVIINIPNLTKIETPAAITNVANGTNLTEIVLPEHVNIQTTAGQKSATVKWDLSTAEPAYDPSKEDQQTFIITGEVTLPGGVTNHESLPLTVEISITVEDKAEASLSTIEIINNPAKLEYLVGEALDLTGLQVKLSYNDNTHEIVDFANFSEKGIAISLEQGTVLTLADKSVIVYAGGKSANFEITVNSVQQNQVATPVFIPSSGTYDGKQNVAITCATDGATIYYTIDGSEPTINNASYTDVIAIEKNTIIKAIAVKDGMTNSAIATASYTINYQITVTAGEGGSIDPAGKVTVESGKNQTFIITADNGYNIKDVKVDGLSVGKVNTYEFENINDNHTIAVEFEKDITPPTGKIIIGDNTWIQLLDELTFNLFFKDAQDVTITAEDDSGKAVTIQYHLGDKALTKDKLNALEASQWMDYAKFSIQPDNKLVIYAKLTDHAGNVTYLSSDGIVLDKTPPAFSIAEGTYTKAQTVTVSDNYALASVLLDDVEQLPAGDTVITNKQITLDANGTYVIKATDKAGNEAAITVTIELTNLTEITAPTAITDVANGTPLKEINLPKQVTIVTSSGNMSAVVAWDSSVTDPAYDSSKTEAQTFIISGEVKLPDGVTNTDNVSLEVTISVTVAAKVVVTVSKVEISTMPTKTTYTEGEALDLTGLQVKLSYSNDTSEIVALADFANKGITTNLNNGATLAVSDTAITISVEGKSTTFNITVNVMQTVETPTFSPEHGTYTGTQTVTLSSKTEGATIYYTTDGTKPTTSSTEYTAPITVSSTMTIKAIAVKNGMKDSAVASAAYTIQSPPPAGTTPSFTQHPSNQAVTENQTATFTVIATGDPAPTYQWQVNKGNAWEDITGATGASYTTPAITANMNGWQYRCVATNDKGTVNSNVVTLTVSPVTYVITATAEEGGSIDPAGEVTVENGKDQTFTITTNSNYRINEILVDGKSVTVNSTYTFEKVTDDHTIQVSFTYIGSSGPSTPPVNPPVKPPVEPEPEPEPVIPDENGNAEIKVDEKKAEELLEQAVNNDSNALELLKPEQITDDLTSVSLPKADLATISEKIAEHETINSVSIATSTGTIVVEQEVLAGILESTDAETVSFAVNDAKDKLTEEQKQAVGNNPVFEINIHADDQKVTSFNGKTITISLPYELKDGEDPNNIVIYHLKDDGTVERMNGYYDKESKQFIFETNHLSMFFIAYEAAEPVTPDQPDDNKNDNIIYYILAAIVVIILVIALAYYFLQKKQ